MGCAEGDPCPVCDGDEDFCDDYYDDDYCDECGEEVGYTSHYHCGHCGQLCSMMGHLGGPAFQMYTCDPTYIVYYKIEKSFYGA